LSSVAWSGRTLVAVGEGGTAISSTDGSAWRVEAVPTLNGLNAVCWIESLFVAFGDFGTVLVSPQEPLATVPLGRKGVGDRGGLTIREHCGKLVLEARGLDVRARVKIYALSGRKVAEIGSVAMGMTIDITELRLGPGRYLLVAEYGARITTKSFCVVR